MAMLMKVMIGLGWSGLDMGWACGTLLAVGVLTVVLQAWDEAWYETVEDAFEWVLTLLLQSNFLAGYFVWRQAGWKLVVKERD